MLLRKIPGRKKSNPNMSSVRSANVFLYFLLGCGLLQAHAISMSNGEVTVRGDHLDYILSMPTYEAAHTPSPDRAFLDHIHFSSRGETARLVQKSCHEDAGKATLICAAEYVFSQPVDRLDVDCTLYQVTVPNHVHLLRAENGGKRDQAVFDYSFSRATLRFRPPTAFEVAVQQGFEGMLRAVAGPVQLLFLAALVLAARGRRELLLLAAMFLAGEIAAALLAGSLNWQPPVRFVEAAMALSVAYLAVEILFLPEAGGRSLIAGVLGGFHGLSLYLVLAGGGFRPAYVLAGAAISELAVIAALGFALWMLKRRWVITRMVQASAGLLLVFGMTWFFLRMKN
jgi:HupE / UreJ protein